MNANYLINSAIVITSNNVESKNFQIFGTMIFHIIHAQTHKRDFKIGTA